MLARKDRHNKISQFPQFTKDSSIRPRKPNKYPNIINESERKTFAWPNFSLDFLQVLCCVHWGGSQALNGKKGQMDTLAVCEMFVLPCNKVHSGVKSQTNLFHGNIQFSPLTVNKAAAQQASERTSPPFGFFNLQGELLVVHTLTHKFESKYKCSV